MAFGRPVQDDRRSGPGGRLVSRRRGDESPGAGETSKDTLTLAGNGSKGTTTNGSKGTTSKAPLSARGAPAGSEATEADSSRRVRGAAEVLGGGGGGHVAAARPP